MPSPYHRWIHRAISSRRATTCCWCTARVGGVGLGGGVPAAPGAQMLPAATRAPAVVRQPVPAATNHRTADRRRQRADRGRGADVVYDPVAAITLKGWCSLATAPACWQAVGLRRRTEQPSSNPHILISSAWCGLASTTLPAVRAWSRPRRGAAAVCGSRRHSPHYAHRFPDGPGGRRFVLLDRKVVGKADRDDPFLLPSVAGAPS